MLIELLSIIDQHGELLEDLGNLKIIDKKFINALKTGSGKDRVLFPKLGKNSKIEKRTFKNPVEAFKALETEKGFLLAVVDTQLDKQVAVFTIPISSGKWTARTSSFDVGLDLGYFKVLADKASMSDEYEKRIKKDFNSYGDDSISKVVNMDSRKANPIIKMIADLYKKAKMVPEYLVVFTDDDRLNTQRAREKTRHGQVKIPTNKGVFKGEYKTTAEYAVDDIITYKGMTLMCRKKCSGQQPKTDGSYDEFYNNVTDHKEWTRTDGNAKKEALDALRHRLDKYKSSKAKGVNDPEELLKMIISDGYIDKFKFDGQTYDYAGDRINIRAMRSGDKREQSYLEYKINGDTPEYKEQASKREEIRKVRQSGVDRPVDKAKVNKQLDELSPPRALKIILNLVGGNIVPVAIEPEHGSMW